jgi:hypothetical protein
MQASSAPPHQEPLHLPLSGGNGAVEPCRVLQPYIANHPNHKFHPQQFLFAVEIQEDRPDECIKQGDEQLDRG